MADVLPQGNKERAYQHEHSWDQLEEDEHGRLRSVVRVIDHVVVSLADNI